MTRIIDADGNVLIERLDFVPSPGERIDVGGKLYVVSSDVPVTRQVEKNAMGHAPFMRFVVAKPATPEKQAAGKVQASGRRGAAVEG